MGRAWGLCLIVTAIRDCFRIPTMVYKGNTWQLTKAQRELVNNCFEEHQYETAIATLEQLCTSEFNPWP